MSSTPPVDIFVDIFVDIDELHRVYRELESLVTELDELASGPAAEVSAASMGSADVADAVHRFAQRWAEGRDRITENLRACLRYAATAAEQYARTEDGLRSAMVPGPGSAP